MENLCDIIKEDSNILDIGSGSGYLTACLAKMVKFFRLIFYKDFKNDFFLIGSKGKVIGIEHIEELVNASINNIRKNNADLLDSGKLEIRTGDGRMG